MATYLAHIRVKAGCEEFFEKAVSSLHAATHTVEPRMLRYEYWRGGEERMYYALASFQDFHAFLDHQTSEHHESALADLSDAIESMTFEWVDPVGGASPLPPTDMQPLPDGATQAAARYSERFAIREGAWWSKLREGGRPRRG